AAGTWTGLGGHGGRGRASALLGALLALGLHALAGLALLLGLGRYLPLGQQRGVLQLDPGGVLALAGHPLAILPLRRRPGRGHVADDEELLAHGPEVADRPVDEQGDR